MRAAAAARRRQHLDLDQGDDDPRDDDGAGRGEAPASLAPLGLRLGGWQAGEFVQVAALGRPEIEDEQRHGDLEDAVGQGFEPSLGQQRGHRCASSQAFVVRA